jgi:sec-independent protein translocase protein TatA
VIGDILQPTHLLFILVIALIVLGPKRLPEVGRSLGRGLRDFKAAINGEEMDRPEEVVRATPAEPVQSAPQTVVAVAEPAEDAPRPAGTTTEPVEHIQQ